MKKLRRVVAIILCLVTLCSGLALCASAHNDAYGKDWVEARILKPSIACNFFIEADHEYQDVLSAKPYKSVMVRNDGVYVKDFMHTKELTPETLGYKYYTGRIEYINNFYYERYADCYYAQYKIVKPDIQSCFKELGASEGFKALFSVAFVQMRNQYLLNNYPDFFYYNK